MMTARASLVDWIAVWLQSWEAVAGIIAAVGTVAALIIAAVSFRRSVADNHFKQARLVYAETLSEEPPAIARFDIDADYFSSEPWSDPPDGPWAISAACEIHPQKYSRRFATSDDADQVWGVVIRVHNRSNELIGRTAVRIPGAGNSAPSGRPSFDPVAVTGSVPPKSHRDFTFWVPQHNPVPHRPEWVTGTVFFTDAVGETWTRDGALPVRPLNGPIPAEATNYHP